MRMTVASNIFYPRHDTKVKTKVIEASGKKRECCLKRPIGILWKG